MKANITKNVENDIVIAKQSQKIVKAKDRAQFIVEVKEKAESACNNANGLLGYYAGLLDYNVINAVEYSQLIKTCH